MEAPSRCPKCDGMLLREPVDVGSKGWEPFCLICGWRPRILSEEKQVEMQKVSCTGRTRPALTPDEGDIASHPQGVMSPAGDALSRYSQAAGNYIRLRDKMLATEEQLRP